MSIYILIQISQDYLRIVEYRLGYQRRNYSIMEKSPIVSVNRA